MKTETLNRILSQCDISKGVVLIPGKAVYIKKRSLLKNNKGKIYRSECYEYIVLLHEGKRVGGIHFYGNHDLHLVIFKKYRGQHFMSSFLKTGWIRKIKPDLKALSTLYKPRVDPEYKAIRRFAKILKVRLERAESWWRH